MCSNIATEKDFNHQPHSFCQPNSPMRVVRMVLVRHFAKVSFILLERDQDRIPFATYFIPLLYPLLQTKPSIMLSLRMASRVSRTNCVRSLRQLRHESTNASNSSTSGGSSLSQSLIGGLAGGGLVFLGGYTYYHFSGNDLFEVSTAFHPPVPRNANHLQEQRIS